MDLFTLSKGLIVDAFHSFLPELNKQVPEFSDDV